MRALTHTIRDLHEPGAVEAEHVLKMLHEHELDNDDQAWREKIFRVFPRRFANKIAREYEEKYIFESRRDANLYLLDHWDQCQKRNIPLCSNDYQLEQLSKKYSEEMRQTANVIYDEDRAVVRIWKMAENYGIKPPSLYDPNTTPNGILRRLWDDQWWLRQLRKAHARNLEAEAVKLGLVHKHANLYISEESFNRYKEQKIRNRRILSRLVAINDQEQMYMLEHLIDKGMSNPTNRRNELMCRVFGFETIANDLNHVADFMTITCPSRMHSMLSKGGKNNPKYDGTTPHEAQKYLTKIWSRIRAKLKRDEIVIYGFRVAEPHSDGTPHWHILVFADQNNIKKIRDIFAHYALEEDGEEQGAKEHRFTYKPIDKAKGSAIGYIAKYISKNIDGYAIDLDEKGLDAKLSAERVTAWASTWGIRQFQQFGGVPVTIWRELRRTTSEIPEGILTEAHHAADSGDWAKFLMTLGGPSPARKDLPIQLAKKECKEPNKYGESKGKQIFGVQSNNLIVPTRIIQWRILSTKQLQQEYQIRLEAATAAGGHSYARVSAVRMTDSGEAALEFCQ